MCCFFFGILSLCQAQSKFQKEVDGITTKNDSLWDSSKETIVFTGSSSIRLWNDLQERFPNHQILNSGFGGSETSDLLFHLDNLVLKYQPTKIFIYEGDNDIAAKKRPKEIIATSEEVIDRIHGVLPQAEVILISAKPSLARWKLKNRYKRLNRRFLRLSKRNTKVYFADVWSIMLNGRRVRNDIFVNDGLHMNEKGYALWYEKIKSFFPKLNSGHASGN